MLLRRNVAALLRRDVALFGCVWWVCMVTLMKLIYFKLFTVLTAQTFKAQICDRLIILKDN